MKNKNGGGKELKKETQRLRENLPTQRRRSLKLKKNHLPQIKKLWFRTENTSQNLKFQLFLKCTHVVNYDINENNKTKQKKETKEKKITQNLEVKKNDTVSLSLVMPSSLSLSFCSSAKYPRQTFL